ncbi:unnamed protein product [Linum trigynum]|uniref:CCHC-type domain-containing protein n=1 Tax=Linum trigynum TaxID=586398 RepID=A0AAV2FE36_9ROSI
MIQCFKCHGRGHKANQCPNSKTLVLRDGQYVTDDEEQSSGDEFVDEEIEVEKALTGKLLGVSKRALTAEASPDSDQSENMFHSRCLVAGKLLSLIVDGGSCDNVISQDAVSKLGLKTPRHPEPYNLHWLNDYGAIQVTKRAKVSFEIGGYQDELDFDVAPMQAAHVLLGRP